MECEPLTADRIDETAIVLAAAFRANPGFCAALPGLDEATRERKLRRPFRAFIRTCLVQGEPSVVLEGGRVIGASLCFGPGTYPLSIGTWLRTSTGAIGLGPTAMLRLVRIDAWMRKGHRPAPHWYLFMLGVEPGHHGRGFGGALLRRLSARVDGDGVHAYLETDKPENLALYRRFGYGVTEEAQVGGFSSLTMWRMERPATAR